MQALSDEDLAVIAPEIVKTQISTQQQGQDKDDKNRQKTHSKNREGLILYLDLARRIQTRTISQKLLLLYYRQPSR